MTVFTKYIFHKSSDIACHANLLNGPLGGNSTDLLSKIIAGEAFHFDLNQTRNLYDEDTSENARIVANQGLRDSGRMHQSKVGRTIAIKGITSWLISLR